MGSAAFQSTWWCIARIDARRLSATYLQTNWTRRSQETPWAFITFLAKETLLPSGTRFTISTLKHKQGRASQYSHRKTPLLRKSWRCEEWRLYSQLVRVVQWGLEDLMDLVDPVKRRSES